MNCINFIDIFFLLGLKQNTYAHYKEIFLQYAPLRKAKQQNKIENIFFRTWVPKAFFCNNYCISLKKRW